MTNETDRHAIGAFGPGRLRALRARRAAEQKLRAVKRAEDEAAQVAKAMAAERLRYEHWKSQQKD